MAHNEDTLIDELRKQFTQHKPLAFVYKLHGGPYQAGLPDLLVAMERAAALIEAKWASDADFERPLLEAFATKLTDQQALNLGQLRVLDGPLRARALIGGAVESDELTGHAGTLCVAYDLHDLESLKQFHTLTMLEIAHYLLDLRRGERTTLGCAHLLQMQLVGKGERWHAGHLLVGTQYVDSTGATISAAMDKDKALEDA